MFNFLKNWFSKGQDHMRSLDELKQDISEGSVASRREVEESEAAWQGEQTEGARTDMVSTDVSLHPTWEQHLDAEKKYTLRFLQAELPQMQDGTIGVTGFSMLPKDEGIIVAMFVRNASRKTLRMHTVGLSLNLDGREFARDIIDLSDLGEIPAYHSRPWEVFFPKETFKMDDFTFTNWKISLFLEKQKYIWPKDLDLDPAMEARMAPEQKERLQQIAARLMPLEKNKVDIVGFDIGKKEDGRLVVGMLFRNARSEEFAPTKLRVSVAEASGDVIASGVIDTSTVQVRPHTSKPWMVVFPLHVVKKPDASLEDWKLTVREP